jgi:formylglycine-generating enzyme required for sulfatase activity
MVDIVGGSFLMGDANGDEDAQPVHKVELAAFRLSENEITKMRFQQFVKYSDYVSEAEKNSDGLGCAVYNSDGSWGWRQGFNWKKTGFLQSDRDPVVCVSWNDAQAYVDWLSKEWKERRFKLVAESEWEYAARATGTSQYPMGETLGNNKTVCDGCGSIWDVKRTAPAGSFALNKFKLHAMPGNVWEWTRDCWHDNYTGAPKTNAAWDTGDECGRRVLRGGSWFNKQQYLQSAYRGSNKINYRGNNVGFRIAENDLKPVPEPDVKHLP